MAKPTTEPTASKTNDAIMLDLRRLSLEPIEAEGPSPSIPAAPSLMVGLAVGEPDGRATGLEVTSLATGDAVAKAAVGAGVARIGERVTMDGALVGEAERETVGAAVGAGVGRLVVAMDMEKSIDMDPSKPPTR
jgi:hypothetical protein